MPPQVRDDGGATELPAEESHGNASSSPAVGTSSTGKQRLEDGSDAGPRALISVAQKGWRRPHLVVAASVELPLTPAQTYAIITHPENEQVGGWADGFVN